MKDNKLGQDFSIMSSKISCSPLHNAAQENLQSVLGTSEKCLLHSHMSRCFWESTVRQAKAAAAYL